MIASKLIIALTFIKARRNNPPLSRREQLEALIPLLMMRGGINPINGRMPDFEGMSEEQMYNYFVSY